MQQIADKKYEAELEAQGFEKSRIYSYGFAFRGKKVEIAGARQQ